MAVSGTGHDLDLYHEFLAHGTGIYHVFEKRFLCKHDLAGADLS